jgi:phytoene dehydrogenase-like protein
MVDVCVIGAGPAGLSCARLLRANDLRVTIVEAADDIGGRLRTDQTQGFLLDRGFQVLQTDYPEAQRQLEYHSLDLHPFLPGALIRRNGRWQRFVDPFRSPGQTLSAAWSGLGGMRDKLRLFSLRRKVLNSSLPDLFKKPERPLWEALQQEGFSEKIIEGFFRPFFTAVFFDQDLHTTSRMFEFVFRILATGSGTLPGKGIAAVPRQLARSFPQDMVQLNSSVQEVEQGRVKLASGQEIQAKAVVLAADGMESARLLRRKNRPEYRSVRCLYFQAPEPPIQEPLIGLNGEGRGPLTSLCVPSQTAPSYAPEGQALISATVVGEHQMDDEVLVRAVMRQAEEWFGSQVRAWNHIHSYNISRALPVQTPPTPDPFRRQVRVGTGLYLAGDLGSLSSLQWALLSGRKAAEAVIQDFGLTPQSSNLTEGVLDSEKGL